MPSSAGWISWCTARHSRRVRRSRARSARPRARTSASSLDISAYSLVALTRGALPLMEKRGGGSVVTLSFLGSDRVFPNYNVMGVAKAALESTVRYLAADVGPKNIRVNAVSAGPIKTLAAAGIKGFSSILHVYPEKAPLRRNVDASEVAEAAAFLLSDAGRGVTGEVLLVDAGYHVDGACSRTARPKTRSPRRLTVCAGTHRSTGDRAGMHGHSTPAAQSASCGCRTTHPGRGNAASQPLAEHDLSSATWPPLPMHRDEGLCVRRSAQQTFAMRSCNLCNLVRRHVESCVLS